MGFGSSAVPRIEEALDSRSILSPTSLDPKSSLSNRYSIKERKKM